jgi:hypothetical protein
MDDHALAVNVGDFKVEAFAYPQTSGIQDSDYGFGLEVGSGINQRLRLGCADDVRLVFWRAHAGEGGHDVGFGQEKIAKTFHRVNVNIHCAGGQLFTIFQVIKVLMGAISGNVYGGFPEPVLELFDRLNVVADRSFGKSFQLKKRNKFVT